MLSFEGLVGPLVPSEALPDSVSGIFRQGGWDLIMANSLSKAATAEENVQVSAIESLVKEADPGGLVSGEGVLIASGHADGAALAGSISGPTFTGTASSTSLGYTSCMAVDETTIYVVETMWVPYQFGGWSLSKRQIRAITKATGDTTFLLNS